MHVVGVAQAVGVTQKSYGDDRGAYLRQPRWIKRVLLHTLSYGCVMSISQILTMSSTVAARRGIGFVTMEAQERPVKLTSHGKPVAVVLSAAEYDEQRRLLREAELKVLEIAANLVADRSVMLSARDAKERLLAAG